MVSVLANSPLALGPQCATVSASARPGRRAISSVHLRIWTELRRCSPAGRVSDMPLGMAARLSGPSRRSMVDALIERTCSSASPSTSSSSPSALSSGIHWSSIAFMYGPHGMPINSHNRSNSRCVSSPYFGLRPRPGPGLSSDPTACESRRRAVDLPMPTATSRSMTSPFCFFVPLAYSALNLFASRFLVAMSSPPSIRQASPHPAMPDGISRSPFMTNKPEFRAQTLRQTSVPSALSGSAAIIEESFHRLAPPMPWPME